MQDISNASSSEQYNPVYINDNNTDYIIYSRHCDEQGILKIIELKIINLIGQI